MTHFIHNITKDFLSIIFPKTCIHCGNLLLGDEHDLCIHCLSQIEWCHIPAQEDNDVEKRLIGQAHIEAGASLFIFRKNEVVQDIMHHIKYHGNTHLAKYFGELLGTTLKNSRRFDDIDIIVPVPLHWLKKRQRGYNQSELIGQAIAQILQKPISTHNLYRKHYTQSQTHRNREQRAQNMNKVFSVHHPSQFIGKHILLIDDVITTGATTIACYHALQAVSGIRISIASLALTGR